MFCYHFKGLTQGLWNFCKRTAAQVIKYVTKARQMSHNKKRFIYLSQVITSSFYWVLRSRLTSISLISFFLSFLSFFFFFSCVLSSSFHTNPSRSSQSTSHRITMSLKRSTEKSHTKSEVKSSREERKAKELGSCISNLYKSQLSTTNRNWMEKLNVNEKAKKHIAYYWNTFIFASQFDPNLILCFVFFSFFRSFAFISYKKNVLN